MISGTCTAQDVRNWDDWGRWKTTDDDIRIAIDRAAKWGSGTLEENSVRDLVTLVDRIHELAAAEGHVVRVRHCYGNSVTIKVLELNGEPVIGTPMGRPEC